ncbi:MAG: hypothetical protein A2360_04895 [Candidatus Staskawiczbacteria bacterium RIFOXYB1_FULL_32_11]|uniref:Uncharacterized protein n=1 Tax=Candidatus Staskawiczbacteria bacterium RIFOXYD1_FULL_32_13 TaxID=1802234 RepID=A0A1G2JL16_9BACT|nr:MAG: hypothetical protein UR22_C0001G0014 [Parcubacteria group bacterium GW2011_GWC2_32_10]OGZ79754.1 MAG: hypothetical protein A2360_04895 [Candidatus Staskawiczbacteria bacterium RIFOXYB1_FULL_32_11]OGZ81027.1 MAG: hypothetical protein A2256_04220 [Candidatus Staskawiczbacteria bacterium RIFOXYA2_FULL_32_7]OGZ87653.1 MAG: hypothetical protein A2561_03070 [Candidatus Staskawiczbacteria bacterium RIFOXYD1_FULL_32_13]
MPKFNPDSQLNIHELAVEEPEKKSELHFDPERDITEEDYKKAEKRLKLQILQARRPSDGKWVNICQLASEIKFLDSKRNLGIEKEDWEGMKKELKAEMEGWGAYSFEGMAGDMKVLAAEEVKVTGKGLEINMRKTKTLESETPQIPEQKEF